MENKIKIITDAAADLSFEFKNQNPNIEILEFPILYKAEDISSLENDKFLEILKNGDEIPSTSQINPNTYINCFEKYLEYDILYICLGSKLSGTFSSAMLAKQMLEEENQDVHITIFDTEANSAGEGLLVEQAYKLMEDGKNIPEIIKELECTKKHMIFRAIVDDIKYVYKGGRLSKTNCIIGTALNIKPILSINDNICQVVNKARGLKKANKMILDELKEKKVKIAYVGTTIANEMYQSFKESLNIPFKEFQVGKSVSVHSGPLCYGIIYITD